VRKKFNLANKLKAGRGLTFIAGLVILIVWDSAIRIFGISRWILPPPSAVAISLYEGLFLIPIESGDLFVKQAFYIHTFYTLSETLIGWIMGIVLGLLMATILFEFKTLRRALLPYINATQSLPKLAIAPLLLIWFGIGMNSKIALVGTVSFFPVMLNTLLGYESVQAERVDLMRALGASGLVIYKMIRLPSALPLIFTGVEIGLLFSFLAAVAGEYVSAIRGLGMLVITTGQTLDTPGLFAVLVVMTVLAWGSDAGVRALSHKICFWAIEEKR
jgi:NitT/TauT family transport system permease protein